MYKWLILFSLLFLSCCTPREQKESGTDIPVLKIDPTSFKLSSSLLNSKIEITDIIPLEIDERSAIKRVRKILVTRMEL